MYYVVCIVGVCVGVLTQVVPHDMRPRVVVLPVGGTTTGCAMCNLHMGAI